MTDRVAFLMSDWHRAERIKRHRFFVEQAHKRLLASFAAKEVEAKRFADQWLRDNESKFDPERHDPADFEEQAYELGCELYQLLEEMENTTRLVVVAGMYHEWDKQVRAWLTGELDHWLSGAAVKKAIWDANSDKVFEFLECLKWPLRARTFHADLDACRLVVNAYKHGQGNALEDIKARFPHFLDSPSMKVAADRRTEPTTWLELADHTDLHVTTGQIDQFAQAIEAFWKEVPETIWLSQIGEPPAWFVKAAKKDVTVNAKP